MANHVFGLMTWTWILIGNHVFFVSLTAEFANKCKSDLLARVLHKVFIKLSSFLPLLPLIDPVTPKLSEVIDSYLNWALIYISLIFPSIIMVIHEDQSISAVDDGLCRIITEVRHRKRI